MGTSCGRLKATAVARSDSRKKGNVRDTFEHDGRVYKILKITKIRLEDAIAKLHWAEGFRSPLEMRVWAMNEYGSEFDLDMFVFAHFYACVPEFTEKYLQTKQKCIVPENEEKTEDKQPERNDNDVDLSEAKEWDDWSKFLRNFF